jgi:hypothetical protein
MGRYLKAGGSDEVLEPFDMMLRHVMSAHSR